MASDLRLTITQRVQNAMETLQRLNEHRLEPDERAVYKLGHCPVYKKKYQPGLIQDTAFSALLGFFSLDVAARA